MTKQGSEERVPLVSFSFGKRGQMEILGLAMVVVLVTLGLMFFLRFYVLQPVDDVGRTYTTKTLATDIIAAMMRTGTDCHEQDVKDLLIDCNENYPLDMQCPNGMKSCRYSAQVIDDMLQESLIKWNRNFKFNVSGYSADISYDWSKPCLRSTPGIFHYSTDVGDLMVRVDVCE